MTGVIAFPVECCRKTLRQRLWQSLQQCDDNLQTSHAFANPRLDRWPGSGSVPQGLDLDRDGVVILGTRHFAVDVDGPSDIPLGLALLGRSGDR